MTKEEKFKKCSVIFGIALTLTVITLFCGDNVILTDNGDYARVMRLCSLEKSAAGELEIALTSDNFIENLRNILFTPTDLSTYPSSQIFFARVSVALNFILNTITHANPNNYNLFLLGILMSIMYSFALSFALSRINFKNKYIRYTASAVVLVMMCDIGYVSYFNSLYAEGLQHILLITLIGFLITAAQRKLRAGELILFFGVLTVYGQSKFFNIPIAVIIGLILLALSFKYNLGRKDLIVHVGAWLLSVIFMICTMVSMPKWISGQTNYNAVFYGILKDCDDTRAKEYLKNDLSLDSELYVLKNTHHYVSDFSDIEASYDIKGAEEISKIKLVTFYIKHPTVTASKISDIAQHSGVIRNIFFMNENYMSDPFRNTLWSRIRERSGFDTVYINLIVVSAFLFELFICLKRNDTPTCAAVTVMFLLALLFGYTYMVPYISNGEADLAKHMYAFIEIVDIAVGFILLLASDSKRKIRITSFAVIAAVFISSVTPYRTAETISFGGYEWLVIDESADCKTLLSKTAVSKRTYSSVDNNYRESDIHRWLNDEFTDGLSSEEKEKLYFKTERMVLSENRKEEAEHGNRDFYCCAFPKKADTDYSSAYSQYVAGSVFLPTAEHIASVARKGYRVSLKDGYWLSTPYFRNPQKARYVSPDGLVYFETVSEELGIRPIIYLKTDN